MYIPCKKNRIRIHCDITANKLWSICNQFTCKTIRRYGHITDTRISQWNHGEFTVISRLCSGVITVNVMWWRCEGAVMQMWKSCDGDTKELWWRCEGAVMEMLTSYEDFTDICTSCDGAVSKQWRSCERTVKTRMFVFLLNIFFYRSLSDSDFVVLECSLVVSTYFHMLRSCEVSANRDIAAISP